MNTTISNKIKIASLIAIACTMLGKILGLLREMKIAEALGASASSDAYNVAYLLVITLFGLFSSAYSNSLMPIAAEQYGIHRALFSCSYFRFACLCLEGTGKYQEKR